MKSSNFCSQHPKELMRHFCITCISLICVECIVDHSGHEFVRKEESSKHLNVITFVLVYILKENGNIICKNLGNLSYHTDYLQKQGFELLTEVKQKKCDAMNQINDYFEKVIKQS